MMPERYTEEIEDIYGILIIREEDTGIDNDEEEVEVDEDDDEEEEGEEEE
jgi:hypothetical protein